MKNLEYNTLYKFMVSFGLALIVFAFAGPWLLLREPFHTITKQSEISQLTPTAQRIIKERQALAELAGEVLPYVSLVLFALGSGTAMTGMIKWSNRQSVHDQKEDVELQKAKLEVQQLSASEAEARVEVEAKETVTAEMVDQPEPTARQRYLATLAKLFVVERLALEKLRTAFIDSHTVEERIKVANNEIDARLRNKNSDEDYLLEIKYLRTGASAWLASRAVHALAYATRAYLDRTGRKAIGLLLIVLGDSNVEATGLESAQPWTAAKLHAQLRKDVKNSSVDVRPLVLAEEEFVHTTPQELKTMLLDAPR